MGQPPWSLLYSFRGGADGMDPLNSGVAIGPDGDLFGTTFSGGKGHGTVFQLAPPSTPGGAWSEPVLHSFRFADGVQPHSGVIADNHGTLYGTAYGGGTICVDHPRHGCGSVFQLDPPAAAGRSWKLTVLHRFAGKGDGASPLGGLVMGEVG